MNKRRNLFLIASVLFFAYGCVLAGGTSVTETPPADSDTVVLNWSRSGGIAGFCDTLVITADGRATAMTCAQSQASEPVQLSPQQNERLQTWLAEFGTLVDAQTDDSVADSMMITLEVYGYGQGAASDDDVMAMREFAASVFAQLLVVPTEVPETAGPCTATAVAEAAVYSRPDMAASLFGTLSAGESVFPAVQSTEGWLGFDPGVAQAGNVGVFRNRWVYPDENLSVSGDCAGLPVAPVISSTACYTMAMFDTPVFSAPDASSNLVLTLSVEGFAAVAARNAAGWVQIDLNDSSQPLAADGWIEPSAINFNGPCDTLPELPH